MAGDNTQDEILDPPKMTILSDHPILREEDKKKEPDSFTLPSRLGAVYDIIRHKNTRPPLAVAIYGDWGTGKSSAMRWLSDALEQWSDQAKAKRKGHARVRTVWFDPWKYTKREDVWRGLISEVIIRAITVRGATLQTVTKAAGEFSFFLGRSFLNALSSLKLKVGGKADAIAAGAKADATVDFAMLTKIAEDYRQTNHPEKAYLNEFETALREWVKAQLGEDDRMVLFIDDLDRCLPGVVLEVLEALKLYLNIPQLIFVVGLDRDVVESVVEKHYAEQGLGKAKAKHYLDKMFQVEVEIPPSQTLMASYITGQIEAMDAASEHYWSKSLDGWKTQYKSIIEEKITDLAAHNPREVKRLLNSTLLRATAAARDGSLGGTDAERFTQGCQVYLIHCYLKKYVPKSGGLLRENEILRFLKAWSDFIAAHPGNERSVGRSEREGRDVVASGDEPKAELPKSTSKEGERKRDPEADAAYKKLSSAMPCYHEEEYFGQAIPLLDQSDVRDLLVIPFSPDVAAAAVIDGDDGEGRDEDDSRQKVGSASERPTEFAGALGSGAKFAQDDEAQAQPDAATVLFVMSATLKSAVARSLGSSVDSLRPDDVRRVRKLDLCLWPSRFDEVEQLAGLSELEWLNLGGTGVRDLRPLASLTKLRWLNLARSGAMDLTPLAKLAALETLFLTQGSVVDLSPLGGLTALALLDVDDTAVKDVAPLANLATLRELSLSCTLVANADPLSQLTALESLDLSFTRIIDIATLSGLTCLRRLDLSGLTITDLTPLSELSDLQELSLWNAKIADVSLLSGLRELRSLTLGCTQVSDITSLANLTALHTLNLRELPITDLSALAGLTSLETLNLSFCKTITDASLRALDGCKRLTSLDTTGTRITKAALERFLATRERS